MHFWFFSTPKIYFNCILLICQNLNALHLFEREESPIHWFTPKCQQQTELGQRQGNKNSTQSRSATPRGWHRPKSLSHHLLSKACSGRSLARTQASQHRMGPPSTERRHHQYPHVAAEESSSGFLFSGSCVEKWGDFSLLIWTHLHRKTKLLD